MAEHDEHILRILRRKQVEVRTGLSRSTIYAMIRDGSFPAPVALGVQNEVEEWITDRIRANRSDRPEKTLRRRSPIGIVTRRANRSTRLPPSPHNHDPAAGDLRRVVGICV